MRAAADTFSFVIFSVQIRIRSDDVEYVLWFSLLRVEIFVIRRLHFSFVKNEACNLSYVLFMFFFLRSYEFSTVLSTVVGVARMRRT